MLREVSGVLHRVFTCAMLCQEYYDNIKHNLIMRNVVCSLLDNIAWDIYLWLCNIAP